MDENKVVIEAFGEIPLSEDFVEKADDKMPSSQIERSTKSPQPTIICEPTIETNQPDVSKTSIGQVDINYNHLTEQPSKEEDDIESERYDRHRRRSSRLTNLKSDLIASGAIFRPPFTPSNSLSKAPSNMRSPRGSIVELPTSEMRSTSVVRTNSRASSQASGSNRAPSLPPVPKNKKYAHVQSRTVSHSGHKKPESQVRIFHKPVKVEAKSKIGSWDNAGHVAGGGQNKIFNRKVEVTTNSRVNSLANISHVAGGGQNKIASQKLDFKERAAPRIDAHLDTEKLQQRNGRDTTRSTHLHGSASESFANKTQ